MNVNPSVLIVFHPIQVYLVLSPCANHFVGRLCDLGQARCAFLRSHGFGGLGEVATVSGSGREAWKMFLLLILQFLSSDFLCLFLRFVLTRKMAFQDWENDFEIVL